MKLSTEDKHEVKVFVVLGLIFATIITLVITFLR